MYTKMGSSNGVTRGQLRPHFGGRQPFLMAALLVGLGILAVSYYNLSSHYTALELQLSSALQRKDSLEKGLRLKDDEFEKSKDVAMKKDREITDLNMQLTESTTTNNNLKTEIQLKTQEISKLSSSRDASQATAEECDNSLMKLRQEISRLQLDNDQLNLTVADLRASALKASEAMKNTNSDNADKVVPPVSANASSPTSLAKSLLADEVAKENNNDEISEAISKNPVQQPNADQLQPPKLKQEAPVAEVINNNYNEEDKNLIVDNNNDAVSDPRYRAAVEKDGPTPPDMDS